MITSPTMHSNLDTLIISLSKLDALLKMASHADLAGLKADTVFHYFWVTEDILEKAKKACDSLVETMCL